MLAAPFLAGCLEIIPLSLLSPIHQSIDERLMLCLGCQVSFLPPVAPGANLRQAAKTC